MGSPSEEYERAIPEALRARVSQDAGLKAFFATFPSLFKSAQKIKTTTPLKIHKQIYAQEMTTFTRINEEDDIIGHSQSVTEQVDPESQNEPPTSPSEAAISSDGSLEHIQATLATPVHTPSPPPPLRY